LPEERWEVVGFDEAGVIPPDGRGLIFHLLSHSGSGETDDVWLAKGIGVVREAKVHHGTYWESRQDLLAFNPSAAAPIR
jgi:hypothetical protein